MQDITELPADQVRVWLTFTSRQDAGKGPAGRPEETCTDWTLDYDFGQKNGLWLIAKTGPHDGTGSQPCGQQPSGD